MTLWSGENQESRQKEEELKKKSAEVESFVSRLQELERISGLTSEQAKEYLLKTVEDEVKIDTAKLYKELESRAKRRSRQKGKGVRGYGNSEMCC